MKFWTFYAPTKSWIEIGRDGFPVYARDERAVGHHAFRCHATGPEAPSEIPTPPADMTKICVGVEMKVTLTVNKAYGLHFTPDCLHFSADDMENAWNDIRRNPGAIQAVVTKVTGFDKKYRCSYCEEQGTDEESRGLHLCKCGAVGSFEAWNPPSTVYKVGDTVKG